MSLFPEVDEEIKNILEKERIQTEKLIFNSKPYRPSNGTEGMYFDDKFCSRCTKSEKCLIILRLMSDYTEEIREKDSYVFCLEDSNFNIKDWL